MEDENTVVDVQPEETSEETPSTEVTQEDESTEVDWEAEAKKAKELATNYKIRAEKAEKKAKEKAPEPAGAMSFADMKALIQEKVHDDDVPQVQEYAALKGISVAEALKSNVVKTILKENEEARNVSVATNVSTARRTKSSVSDDVLLANAQKGVLPESSEDIARLNRARWGIK